VRRAGLVPAVIYGAGKDPVMVSIDPRVIWKALDGGHFYSTLFDIEIEGGGKEKAVARDVQFHPVTDQPLHVDYLRASGKTKLAVQVSVHFINEDQCSALKSGSVLNIVRHEIELMCFANNIPSEIEIDLSVFAMGDSIKISNVTLPDGVEPTITDRDFTIATLAVPRGGSDEVEEDGEGEDATTEGLTATEE
jgi:large subunit ribosomal protein L25